jgi:predicted RNA binding protein YcfA (HicA-like mRNA interferase family)
VLLQTPALLLYVSTAVFFHLLNVLAGSFGKRPMALATSGQVETKRSEYALNTHFRFDAIEKCVYGVCMRSAKVIKKLEAAGWYEVRVTGSHHHFRHDERPGLVTVPHPKADLPTGTLRSIEKQSGVNLTG